MKIENERQVSRDTQAIREMLKKFGKHSIMDLTTAEIQSLSRDMQNLIMSRKEVRETIPRYAESQHFKNGRTKAEQTIMNKMQQAGVIQNAQRDKNRIVKKYKHFFIEEAPLSPFKEGSIFRVIRNDRWKITIGTYSTLQQAESEAARMDKGF